MLIPTKAEILKHYGRLENPQAFIQLDTFYHPEDSLLPEDADGLCPIVGVAYELMSGSYNVRILIRPDTTKDIAIKALRKAANWIEKDDILSSQNKQIKTNEKQTKHKSQRKAAFCELLSKNGFSLDEVKTMLGDCLGDCIPF